ncbi:MAG: threonylcarbamoyl-AMP synthase [Alcanivoracaceae bacterium]|nr:threonylcarbamoyl-AMP synthase [Alcanivoracaceae bacterium]
MTAISPPDPEALSHAAHVLHDGGIIAYPTEAVFGLGCDPANEQAVKRILELKHRDVRKGLLLIGGSYAQIAPWIKVSAQQARFLETAWPYATTYLVDASDRVPAWVRGEHPKVGVRLTQHPVAAALCNAFGGLLVSTSANVSGADPAKTTAQCRQQFGERLDLVVEGECDSHARPSTIIDLASGDILRA